MVNDRDDIVLDIIRQVLEASARSGGTFSETLAVQIEHQVRQDWGGSRPYISHGKAERIAVRDEKIHSAYWDGGERDIKMLARRFALSERQVRRIVNE